MKASTWRQHHKWTGIVLCVFLLMFCLSGIVLNHRSWFADVNVSRSVLSPWYRFNDWNGGLLRGTLPLGGDTVLLYGGGGVWLARSDGSNVEDYNQGLPTGADRRAMRAVALAGDGRLFAVSQFGLFARTPRAEQWAEIKVPTDGEERLSDLVLRGDTLVVVGRSHLYVGALGPVGEAPAMERAEVAVPPGLEGRVTLFKTIWRLHSGELFGMAGKLVMDAVALVLIFLSITGMMCWLMPKSAVRIGKRGRQVLRWTLRWHNQIGRATILLTLLAGITGWCLRPPLMVPLVLAKTKPPVRENAWHDKLRALRYDARQGDWLLFTSEGFFSLPDLDGLPTKIDNAPPVSVMGINVWERSGEGFWLCGSFSGMTVWDRATGALFDYFTGVPLWGEHASPFGALAVSGYTADIGNYPLVIDYGQGTDAFPQPASMGYLPMSLWNVALEVHTGRAYFGNSATYFWIFLAGALVVWCLWSGWRMRAHRPS